VRTRVIVVDDDDVHRRGTAELLADRPELEVVGTATHDEALVWTAEWEAADVVLVDAADPDRPEDHFPGVSVVDHIRRRRSSQETIVIVITGHFFDDAVRRRMREAGADFFYHRLDLRKKQQLYEAVLHPERARAGVPAPGDPEALFRLGITESTHVNKAVGYANASGLRPAIADRAGQRSRLWHRRRQAFNEIARLHTINGDGTLPDRQQAEPSLPQIERFLNWAARVKDHPVQ
jgi:CheY-like chemotaxis protein